MNIGSYTRVSVLGVSTFLALHTLGWTATSEVPDDLNAIQAVNLVSRDARKVELAPRYGAKFADVAKRATHTLANPYLSTAGLFFASMDAIRCAPDGGVIVTGRAGLDAKFNARAVGAWKAAADGSVRALHVRATTPQGSAVGPSCEAPFNQSGIGLNQVAAMSDGGLVWGAGAALIKLRADGQLQRLAGPPAFCSGASTPSIAGLVDGAADTARFDDLSAAVPDTQGNIWMVDQKGCSLRRLSPAGQVTTVVSPEQACGKDLKGEDQLLLSNLTWDAAHNELVSGGWLTVAKPVHNLYNTIWRIKPTGEFRRVFFSTKLGKSPAKIRLDGITTGNLTVDPKGRIHLITMPMIFEQRGFDIMQIYRVDEAKNAVTPITGHKIRGGSDIAALHHDGQAELAVFDKVRGLCSAPDGTFYVLEEHLVRRLDTKGQVSTWLF